MSRFEIGTSGYIGSKKDWLTMPFINCLEINSTFYRLPNPNSIRKYNALSLSPDHKGLIYSVKVSKFITHMKRLKNCKQAFMKFWKSVKALDDNLKVLLFQLPPSFKYNKVNMERLENMTYIPKKNNSGKPINIVFEFRDKSWFRNDVVVLFEKKTWVLGGTLINKKSGTYWMGTMPSGLHLPEKTTNCTYLRIHGGRGYRGGYDKKELQKIKRSVLRQNTALNYVIFNNVFFDSRKKTCKYNKRKIRYAALCNASTFGKMTRKRQFTHKRGGAQGQRTRHAARPKPIKHPPVDWGKFVRTARSQGLTPAIQNAQLEQQRQRSVTRRARPKSDKKTMAAIRAWHDRQAQEKTMEKLDEIEYTKRRNAREREINNRILPHKVLTHAWHSVVDSLPRSRISKHLTNRHLTPAQRKAAIGIERRRRLLNKEYVPWLPSKYQTAQRFVGKTGKEKVYKTKNRKGGGRNRTRKKKGGNGEKWLLLGITHTEMEERKYNDPTNGGEMITFDYGGDDYDGGDDRIDIRGNYYNIELWENLLKSKGENYFDVIFLDGGQHAGPGFSNFGDVRKRVNLKGINEIMQSLLKPNGLFIVHRGLGNFRDGGWIKIDTTIDDPFGDTHGGYTFLVFINPKGLHEIHGLEDKDHSYVSELGGGGRKQTRRKKHKS